MNKCREQTIKARETFLEGVADKLSVASERELKNETEFMVQTVNLLNCVWSSIRTVRDTVLIDAKIEDIYSNIKLLQRHW